MTTPGDGTRLCGAPLTGSDLDGTVTTAKGVIIARCSHRCGRALRAAGVLLSADVLQPTAAAPRPRRPARPASVSDGQ